MGDGGRERCRRGVRVLRKARRCRAQGARAREAAAGDDGDENDDDSRGGDDDGNGGAASCRGVEWLWWSGVERPGTVARAVLRSLPILVATRQHQQHGWIDGSSLGRVIQQLDSSVEGQCW